jgi:hypothetical protein
MERGVTTVREWMPDASVRRGDNNPEVREFYSWCRRAKRVADGLGFQSPCGDHEYQVMLSFYDAGQPPLAAILLLDEWRQAQRRAEARVNRSTRNEQRER